ncbi:hypothetical protein [Desulfosporosinus nitroreducens]|uniref:hypothetical protein n=1 Tax=Desulfosporosinus nitroreducens TaxID=2018668 RepID=UPI00207C1D89|nr:hypothetical protein [Desulfosporosinus nitroreducens]MCO1604760.1 hypothetical protein [Desulfosporosinus nitroreducens]
MLTALNRTDPEIKEKYRETASKIIENMAKMLKVWPPVIRTNLSIIRPIPRGVKSSGHLVVIQPTEQKRSLWF